MSHSAPVTSITSAVPPFASLTQRLVCMLYEAVLLFGVFFAAELIFDLSTQGSDLAALRNWRQLYLFIVLGGYFTYFWGHGGQTLPMKTWHVKLVSANQQKLSFKQASLRYCIAWMWFLPALSLTYLLQIQHWLSIGLFFVGIVAWAATIKFDRHGQFLHDRLAGTQLIALPKPNRISDTE